MILTPDLDVDGGSRSNKHARKLKIGGLFGLYVYPYAIAYKHRSPITHMPLYSTVWRLFYLLLPFIVLLNKNQPTPRFTLFVRAIPAQLIAVLAWFGLGWFWLNPRYIPVLVGWVVGLMVSDMLHWLWDKF